MDLSTIKLIRLQGELGELQQEVSKALQFGSESINPKTQLETWITLRNEVGDVLECIRQLEFNEDEIIQAMSRKEASIEQHKQYEIQYDTV